MLTDKEIINRLKISSGDRILDVGGSMRQHPEIKVDTLVDMIRPEDAPYGSSKLLAKNFVKVDITKDKLPFKDKEFDVVLCTHVLEDLPSPFLIMSEMARVAKKGLIVTPSMGEDMKFTQLDFTDWLTGSRRAPGQAHHKWFFVNGDKGLEVIPKIYPILYTKDFQITNWVGEKEMVYYWDREIKFTEFISLDIHKLIDRYETFMKKNIKFIKKGIAVIFIDNPLNILKAFAKLLIKRGEGYKHRKVF